MHNIYPSIQSTVAIRLRPGDDLKVALDQIAQEYQFKAACILTCVGSLQNASIRYANQPAPVSLEGPFEIVSLTGTLSEKGSHLHISLSDSSGKTIGGHLKEGNSVYTTAEIVIGILENLIFDRAKDETTGYLELSISRKTP